MLKIKFILEKEKLGILFENQCYFKMNIEVLCKYKFISII